MEKHNVWEKNYLEIVVIASLTLLATLSDQFPTTVFANFVFTSIGIGLTLLNGLTVTFLVG